MRRVFCLVTITLVVSTLTTAAVASYVNRYPTSYLGRAVSHVAAVCTGVDPAASAQTRPGAAQVLPMDHPFPEQAIFEMSKELHPRTSVEEIHAISRLIEEPVAAPPAAGEDEFTLPPMPPVREPGTSTSFEIIVEPPFERIGIDFDVDFPLPPAQCVPWGVGVFGFVSQIVDGWMQQWSARPCDFVPRQACDEDCVGPCPEACCPLDLKNVLVIVVAPDELKSCRPVGCCKECADQPRAAMAHAARPCEAGACEARGCSTQTCTGCCESQLVRRIYPVSHVADPDDGACVGRLVLLVCKMVAPSTWEACGGRGVVEYYPPGKCLVVLQTTDVQKEVEQFLGELGQAVASAQDRPTPMTSSGVVSSDSACKACHNITVVVTGSQCQVKNGPAGCKAQDCCKDCGPQRCDEKHVPMWFECPEPMHFVPYVPAEEARWQSSRETSHHWWDTDTDPFAPARFNDVETPEQLPVCDDDPFAWRHLPGHEPVCPYTARCTRYGGCYYIGRRLTPSDDAEQLAGYFLVFLPYVGGF